MSVHEYGGVSLSASEWRELEKLVDSDDPSTVASESLNDELSSAVYRSLLDKGMISGFKTWGGVVYDGLTVAGIDFVEDCREAERIAEKSKRSDRRHDYVVALFSSAIGFILGLIAEEATGLLSGLLAMLRTLWQTPLQ